MAVPKKSRQKPRKQKRKQQAPKGRSSLASRADVLDLYQRSVQACTADCELLERIYQDYSNGPPKVLREDFCGSALLATTWCLIDPSHRAYGVDIHEPTLNWARAHNVEPNAERLGERLTLLQANVLDVTTEKRADIIVAFNFSFCVLKQRAELVRYFDRCRAGLADQGLLVLEMFGGTKAIEPDIERRQLDGFTYIWEQESFNPITNDILCHIHFAFPDGSNIQRAFSYDWRLWGLPEIRDLLAEAGFMKTAVYWAKVGDEADEHGMLTATGEYECAETAEQQTSWLVYIIAQARGCDERQTTSSTQAPYSSTASATAER